MTEPTIRATINGTYDRAGLERLTWPIAWSGVGSEQRAAEEAALSALVDEATEAMTADLDAVAVEIEAGEVVATVHAEDDSAEYKAVRS